MRKGQPIIAAGAGTGISAKFIERGGADLIIIYNSGRFRMAGHGSTCGLMAYGDANAVAMEIGEYEVLPVVDEVPVICGVHATDPRRRMWHWLLKVKDMGFDEVLVIIDEVDEKLALSSRNLTNVVVMTARQANPVALVRSKHVLVTKAAMAKLEEMLK